MTKQDTFYSVRFDTGNTYEALKYYRGLDDLMDYIKLQETLHSVCCEIDEMNTSLFFSWFDQSGKHITTECEHDMWLPAYASLEKFS